MWIFSIITKALVISICLRSFFFLLGSQLLWSCSRYGAAHFICYLLQVDPMGHNTTCSIGLCLSITLLFLVQFLEPHSLFLMYMDVVLHSFKSQNKSIQKYGGSLISAAWQPQGLQFNHNKTLISNSISWLKRKKYTWGLYFFF